MNNKFLKKSVLCGAADFKVIFQTGKKIRTTYFSLYGRLNGLEYPRLGLIVPKRVVKLAVTRNSIKRIVRESFRQNHLFSGFDLLFLAHPAINSLNQKEFRSILDSQWLKLISLFEK